MADDLADIKRQLDALYFKAVTAPVQRRRDLIEAALKAIHSAVAADVALERAFGHLVPREVTSAAAPAALRQEPPPLPHQMTGQVAPNPALVEALRRDGT